jgi:proline iminopeptidase
MTKREVSLSMNSNENPILFLHGGPGLNSYAESELLGPALQARNRRAEFWNEPSRRQGYGPAFRTERAFRNQVESVCQEIDRLSLESGGRKVDVIAHSFACNVIWDALETASAKVGRLILVTPGLSANALFRRIMKLAAADFKSPRPEASRHLEELSTKSQSFNDSAMQEGLLLAGEDAALFTHYWKNKPQMEAFFGVWGRRGASLDVESFQCVLADFAAHLPERDRLARAYPTLDVSVVFGAHDPIVSEQEELGLLNRAFPQAKVTRFESSGHFPHLEELSNFVATFFGEAGVRPLSEDRPRPESRA